MHGEKVFADTNLFLRFLTNDVPEKAEAVESLFRNAGRGHPELVTTPLVIVEIVRALESHYHCTRPDIAGKVLAILNTPGLEVENSDLLIRAAVWYSEKNIDFIDAYNAAWMIKNGIAEVRTFDLRHFKRIEGIDPKEP
ncbi:MAG: PIN domain-containing protein [Acidobacteria bacterium]|nr:PIN domain-containing protein [Acidobacteriota bacterium]